MFSPRSSTHVVSAPGNILEYTLNVTSERPMDGIRLTSFEDTIERAEMIEGGIGFEFARIKLFAKAENISCMVEKYENGTYTTTLPTTTTALLTTTTNLPTTTDLPTTTENPGEGDIKEWGEITDDTKLSEYDQ
jgi:hypothetical protein